MRPPQRVLLTTDAVGGVWNFSLELARGCAAHGIEVVLAVMGPPPSAQQLAQAEQCSRLRILDQPFALEWMEDPWEQVDEAGDWLLDLEREFRPEIIHLNGYAQADLPWQAPVLVGAHSCVRSWWRAVKGAAAPADWQEYTSRVARGLRAADLVVAPSGAMLDALVREYGRFAPSAVIHNGRAATLLRSGIKEPAIFSAGRLWDEAKNLALLDQIAPDLAWPVRLAGAARSPGQAGPVFKNVHLCGSLGEVEMASQLERAAIYAAPAFYEPFGLGILEAALCGCALVLADLPSLRELWNEAAVFLDPRAAAQWRVALEELAKDSPRLAMLGAAARERAADYTPGKMVGDYLAAYGGLLAGRTERVPVECAA